MLMKILREMARGGLYGSKSIARQLGIDESLVEQMITQLQRLGYIAQDTDKQCSAGCNCNDNSSKGCCCSSHNIDINIWRITDKGKNVILE